MTLHTADRKLETLSIAELTHCVLLANIEIAHAISSSRNYTLSDTRRYAIPYQRKLEARRDRFIARLKELTRA